MFIASTSDHCTVTDLVALDCVLHEGDCIACEADLGACNSGGEQPTSFECDDQSLEHVH